MDRQKKKLPKDYPQFIFRISAEDKKRLSALIKAVQTLYNRTRPEDEKIINKNDVIIEALERGLNQMRRNKL